MEHACARVGYLKAIGKVCLKLKIRKHSRQREAILAKIRSTTCHPTADWIYQEVKKEFPNISLGTVYRNLVLFREDGDIVSVGNVSGQERFDGNISPHGHFVCHKCMAVLDIDLPGDQPGLTTSPSDIGGNKIERIDFTAYGTCYMCA